MSALQTAANACLGLTYACTLGAWGLWQWGRQRGDDSARRFAPGLVCAAVGLLTAYIALLSFAATVAVIASLQGFLVLASLGVLLGTQLWRSYETSQYWVAPVIALVALLYPVVVPVAPGAPHAPQATLLYIAQTALHALGFGLVLAAAPAWYDGGAGAEEDSRDVAGLAVLATGLALTSIWAWLNWGVLWQSQPRLNLFAASWLMLLGGYAFSAAERRLPAAALRTAALVVATFGIVGAGIYSKWWGGLAFVAW